MIHLKIIYPSGKEEEQIISGRSLVVGRSLKSDVVITSEGISRKHCLIEFENEKFFVTDLESANGVMVNHERIPPSVKVPYETYQELSLGGIEIQISWSEVMEKVSPEITKSYLQEESRPVSGQHDSPKAGQESAGLKIKLSQNFTMFIGFTAILMSTIYFFQKDSSTVDLSKEFKLKAIKREKPKLNTHLVAESFFTDAEYLELYKQKQCGPAGICKGLELENVKGEGVTRLKGELVVFINPANHSQKPVFVKFRTFPDGQYLIPVLLLARSELFVKFLGQEWAQIHIVLLNKDLKIKDVMRLHTNDFAGLATRRSLLKDLMNISSDAEATEFLKKHNIFKKSDA